MARRDSGTAASEGSCSSKLLMAVMLARHAGKLKNCSSYVHKWLTSGLRQPRGPSGKTAGECKTRRTRRPGTSSPAPGPNAKGRKAAAKVPPRLPDAGKSARAGWIRPKDERTLERVPKGTRPAGGLTAWQDCFLHASPVAAGGLAPRQQPAPPGRALAFWGPGCDGPDAGDPTGREKRGAFPPPGVTQAQAPNRSIGSGHRPCHSATLNPRQPGPKVPGQRPPRPWRALCPRRAGRWLFVGLGPSGLQGTVARGRGKRDAFPVPARTDDSTRTASMAGAIAPATAPH